MTGVDVIARRFRELPAKIQRREARRATRAGAIVIRDAVRENVKRMDRGKSPTKIWRNVAIRESARQSRAVGGVVMRVGILGGSRHYAATRRNRREGKVGKTYEVGGDKRNPGGDTYYWRFLEFGTRHSRARPFMRPAFSQNVDRAAAVVAQELSAGIDRELAT